jgi:hypothetical protein
LKFWFAFILLVPVGHQPTNVLILSGGGEWGYMCMFFPPSQKYIFTQNTNQVIHTGQWFSPCTPLSSTNKTDRHNIAKILLKVPSTSFVKIIFPLNLVT